MRNGVGEATGGTWPTYSGWEGALGGEEGERREAWEGKRKKGGREEQWRRGREKEKKAKVMKPGRSRGHGEDGGGGLKGREKKGCGGNWGSEVEEEELEGLDEEEEDEEVNVCVCCLSMCACVWVS